MSELEYMKCTALSAMESSGEINLEGIKFPPEPRRSVILRLVKRVVSLLVALVRGLANSIKETPAEYNAKVARWREERPPVRGLR